MNVNKILTTANRVFINKKKIYYKVIKVKILYQFRSIKASLVYKWGNNNNSMFYLAKHRSKSLR